MLPYEIVLCLLILINVVRVCFRLLAGIREDAVDDARMLSHEASVPHF